MLGSKDWKTKLGAILIGLFTAALAVDPDPKRTPMWQALMALSGVLFGVGAADKLQKTADAVKTQTAAIDNQTTAIIATSPVPVTALGLTVAGDKAKIAADATTAPDATDVQITVPAGKAAAVRALLGCALFLVMLVGCKTGIGRASSLAFSGVPPSVAVAIDSAEAEYNLRAGYEMTDIVSSQPQTAEGIILQEKFRAELQARMDAQHALFDQIRSYVGVEQGDSPTATQDAAAATRTQLLTATLARVAALKDKGAPPLTRPLPLPKDVK